VTTAGAGGEQRCIFCDALHPEDSSALVVYRGKHSFIILNKYPYNNGHLMVVPARHLASLVELNDAELFELIQLIRTAEMALAEAYSPHGINVGINLGRSAGAGVIGHLHVHLVPRWEGDTNFMTVIGDTRVVPEEPAKTMERLKPVFSRLMC
jgi:ATP adenylyltransferase